MERIIGRDLREIQKLVLAGMFVALGIIVPLFTGHLVGIGGPIVLPMHIPVLLCGLILGPKYGFLCGLLAPALSSLFTGMPPTYPMLPIMLVELPIYGAVSGLLFHKLKWPLFLALPLAMIAGRIGYGLMFNTLLFFNSEMRGATVFVAISAGLPGIVIQLTLIPLIINALNPNVRKEVKFILSRKIIKEAKVLIEKGEATLVIINRTSESRKLKIVKTDNRAGIRGIKHLFETEKALLKNAIIVDKVIGKAAASIMALAEVQAIYGLTTSRTALAMMEENNIKYKYDLLVDAIAKQSGGLCVMEEASLNMQTALEAYEAIAKKFEELRSKE
ncbi:MAG: DUF1893 domain-containing protein [Erysipelotrichales bacterium]|nr:DUF1893 domain-containing protein [Erysipelotrichales bacterium]